MVQNSRRSSKRKTFFYFIFFFKLLKSNVAVPFMYTQTLIFKKMTLVIFSILYLFDIYSIGLVSISILCSLDNVLVSVAAVTLNTNSRVHIQ